MTQTTAPFTTVASRCGAKDTRHEHDTLREAQEEFNNRYAWGMAESAVIYDATGAVVVWLGDYR